MSRIDDEAMAWLSRQTERPLEGEDAAAFAAWYAADIRHQGAYLRAQAIWHSLDRTTIQNDLQPAATETLDKAPTAARPARRLFLMGSAAAAAATAAVLMPRPGAPTVLKTATGEFRKVPLPDRSIASLNSASHVEVAMTDKVRRVVLKSGEAWFKVAKDPDKPFVVEAGDVRVQAVGTAFSVRRHDNGADVLVTEGIVEAWSNDGAARRRQIVAGQEAYVPDRAAEISVSAAPAEIERKLAWRDGNLVFDNETLADAVADFNRANTQKIIIVDPALRGHRFVGQYRIDAPQSFADDVHSLLNVPVRVTDDGILIGAVPSAATASIAG